MNKPFLDKLCSILKGEGVDAMLIAPSGELRFLTGLALHLCERFQGLVVKADGSCFYICNRLTFGEIREKYTEEQMPVYEWDDNEEFTDVVEKAFKAHGLIGKKIAVNGSVRAFNACRIAAKTGVQFIAGRDLVYEMTIIKSPDEMESLRVASQYADEVYEELLKFIKAGQIEADVKAKISDLFLQKGCPGPFSPIVSASENGAMPHYGGSSREIKPGDAIVLDFGCSYKGLRSDTTRTVFVGEPTQKMREVYEIVKQANLAGAAAAKEGAYIPDIEDAARKVIDDAGYGQYFNHRLGHGIGYEGHEAPEIKKTNKRHLERGMAFSIEPGIYIPGEFGVRIEDILLINDKGETEVLNKTTKEMTIL